MDGLYHSRVLELAADISHVGRLAHPMGSSTKVSRVCGSVVTVDLNLKDGKISELGMEVEACALGQAAAAVLAAHGVGASVAEVVAARDGLRAMIKDGAPPPEGRFWELRHLEGVRDYPPRHASTMLAFEAAVAALEQAQAALAPSVQSG
jgi:NifU-like protein involved in Fe-S cluster formation